jgi:hypothetical protein
LGRFTPPVQRPKEHFSTSLSLEVCSNPPVNAALASHTSGGGTFETTIPFPPHQPTTATTPLKAAILPGGNDYAQIHPNGDFNLDVTIAAKGINVLYLIYFTSLHMDM